MFRGWRPKSVSVYIACGVSARGHFGHEGGVTNRESGKRGTVRISIPFGSDRELSFNNVKGVQERQGVSLSTYNPTPRAFLSTSTSTSRPQSSESRYTGSNHWGSKTRYVIDPKSLAKSDYYTTQETSVGSPSASLSRSRFLRELKSPKRLFTCDCIYMNFDLLSAQVRGLRVFMSTLCSLCVISRSLPTTYIPHVWKYRVPFISVENIMIIFFQI